MDEELIAVKTDTRFEKLRNFLINNKKKIIIIFSMILLLVIILFIFQDIKEKKRTKLSNQYNLISINFISGKKDNVSEKLIRIIQSNDETYAPLALFFLIDNKIIDSNEKVDELFNIVINDVKMDKEIKNLVIYKKALFNSDFDTENNLLNTLNPIIQSNSIWKSHALYLMAEYFYSKEELQKSKEFFSKILSTENANKIIKLEAQKRIRRDFSE
jgi:predicted negative regulator of RcsB-dependent stress response